MHFFSKSALIIIKSRGKIEFIQKGSQKEFQKLRKEFFMSGHFRSLHCSTTMLFFDVKNFNQNFIYTDGRENSISGYLCFCFSKL